MMFKLQIIYYLKTQLVLHAMKIQMFYLLLQMEVHFLRTQLYRIAHGTQPAKELDVVVYMMQVASSLQLSVVLVVVDIVILNA